MRRGIVLCAVLLGLLVAAPSASAYIYWTSFDGQASYLGRAGLDGAGVNPSLVTGINLGRSGGGVATDGAYVYWAEDAGNACCGAVGRATIDGAGPDHAFQSTGSPCGTFGVRATATELFWLKGTCSGLNRSIDHAQKTGGQPAMQVAADAYQCGFAVDANFVYWSRGQYIARVPLGGGPPDPTWLDLGAPYKACGMAVTPTHIYWTLSEPSGLAEGYRAHAIGRATIDGMNPSNAFITGTTFTQGYFSPSSIAVEGDYIYWTNQPPSNPDPGPDPVIGSIGRANLDGTGQNPSFIPNVQFPVGIDVDSAGPAAAPPTPNFPPPPGPPPFVPRLYSVGTTYQSFKPSKGSTPIGVPRILRPRRGSPRRAGVHPGTVFTYSVDGVAKIAVAIQRKQGGRLIGGKCRKPTRSTLRKKKCNLTVATLHRTSVSGQNRLPFTGRIKGRALTVGSYLAAFTATGAGGSSKTVSVGFRIVKGK